MRELKFRAWDKRNKKWIDEFSVPYDGKDILIHNTKNINTNSLLEELKIGIDAELIQYTGIKDKNGKEVYEGDILQAYEHIDAVIWREDLCGFSYENDSSRMNLCDWLEHAKYAGTEIIGNIYENPELVK